MVKAVISIAAYLNQIHFCKLIKRSGGEYIQDRDDILVIEMSDELDLSQCPQTEHGMVEWTDFLDRNSTLGGYMDSATYDTVCTFTCVVSKDGFREMKIHGT